MWVETGVWFLESPSMILIKQKKKKIRASSKFSRNLFISENYIGDGCYSYSFLFFFNKKIYKKNWGGEERPNCEG